MDIKKLCERVLTERRYADAADVIVYTPSEELLLRVTEAEERPMVVFLRALNLATNRDRWPQSMPQYGRTTWEVVQEFIDACAANLHPSLSTRATVRCHSVKEAMIHVTSLGLVSLVLPGDEIVAVAPAGKGKVRIGTNAASGWRDGEDAILLRDLRSWLSTLFERAAAAKAKPAAPNGAALAWLRERAEKGVFEISTEGQTVPLQARGLLDLHDWRYLHPDGSIVQRARAIAAASGNPAQQQAVSNVDPETISRFDIRRLTRPGQTSVTVDVTQNFGWYRGMFADPDSCWWNEYNQSRSLLYHMDGFAIRLWDSRGNGAGRVWACPTAKGGVALFNAYGPWNIHGVAALVEHATGEPFRDIEDMDCPHSMFINRSTHYVFGENEYDGTVTLRLPPGMTGENAATAWKRRKLRWEEKKCRIRSAQRLWYDSYIGPDEYMRMNPLCKRGETI